MRALLHDIRQDVGDGGEQRGSGSHFGNLLDAFLVFDFRLLKLLFLPTI